MIIRKERTNHFTIIPNDLVCDERLSYEARGVLCYLLSKPNDWQINCKDIQRVGNIARKKAYSILSELIEAGYVQRLKVDERSKRHNYNYVIFDHSCGQKGHTEDVGVPQKDTQWCPLKGHIYKDSTSTKNPLVANATKGRQEDFGFEEELVDPKQVLFKTLLPKAVQYSKISEAKLRPLFGRWLKTTDNDAELLAEIIRAALEYQPGEFISFVTGSIKQRTAKDKDYQNWMDVWK